MAGQPSVFSYLICRPVTVLWLYETAIVMFCYL